MDNIQQIDDVLEKGLLLIGDWNRKDKKSKTISSRVDVFKNLTEMDMFCFKSAAIIAVYQIFHLID